jgi:hypothetical protein
MPTGSPRRLGDARRRDEESERRKHQRGVEDRAPGEQVHDGPAQERPQCGQRRDSAMNRPIARPLSAGLTSASPPRA